MRRKKVLFVVHQLNFGGVQKALLSALNAIGYDRYDVTLYVRKARTELLPDVNKGVSEVIVNDDKQHYYRKPHAVWMLMRHKLYSLCGKKDKAERIKDKLREDIADQKILHEKKRFFSDGKKYDVAVSYIQGYPAKLVANYIDAARKIMFFHGSTDETHALHESIFGKFDAIVGVNEGVQKILEGLYPTWKNKMTYLANYVDAKEVREKSRLETVTVPLDQTILCSCGRLSPVKGFDLAVKAAKILQDNGERFLWYFVGDGPERSKLEGLIRERGLEDCVMITGMQENPYPWINACDIYVQPSYEEAYGLTIVEAQVLCKPVVSTATVGGKVLLSDGWNGLLTEINEAAIAEAIAKLLRDPAMREKMVENLGGIDYSEHYEQYKTAWQRLLEG